MNNLLNKDISEELGINHLEPEKQQKLLEKVGELMFQNVIIRIFEILKEEDKNQLEILLERNNTDEIMEFMEVKVPNLDKIEIGRAHV